MQSSTPKKNSGGVTEGVLRQIRHVRKHLHDAMRTNVLYSASGAPAMGEPLAQDVNCLMGVAAFAQTVSTTALRVGAEAWKHTQSAKSLIDVDTRAATLKYLKRAVRLSKKIYETREMPEKHYSYFGIGNLRVHDVGDAAMAQSVYKDTDTFRTAAFLRNTMEKLIGGAMIIEDGEKWDLLHDIIMGSFTKKNIMRRVGPLVEEECDRMLRSWEKRGQVEDVEREMVYMTGRVIMRALFSDSMKEQDAVEVLDKLRETISTSTNKSFIGKAMEQLRLPYGHAGFLSTILLRVTGLSYDRAIPIPKVYQDARVEIDKALYKAIRDRRESGKAYDDILDDMIKGRKKTDGQPLNDDEIRDQLLMLIIAGHETTAASLTYTIMEAAKRPDIQADLRAEFREAAAAGPVHARDYSNLPKAQSAVKEAARLHPPVFMGTREVDHDETVGGVHFHKHDLVRVDLRIINRNPAYWEDADTYKPERFYSGTNPRAYMPFGYGKRVCTGVHMAQMEGTYVAASICDAFNIKATSHPEKDHYFFAPHPDRKVSVALTRAM